jgi:hypothetical protein
MAVLVAGVRPVLAAVIVFVPARLISQPVKVATPATAGMVLLA